MNNDFVITGINRIILVDKYEYKERKTVFTHNLKYNEIIFHFSGEENVYFNAKSLLIKAGTVRFLPKGDVTQYVVDRKKSGECIMIAFDSSVPVSENAFTVDPVNAVSIGNLFKKIFSVWHSKSDGYYFDCLSLLYKIFAEIQKQNYIYQDQYNAIRPALIYIEENFLSEKILVVSLAEKCGISESYLKKIFIKKFGIPPIKYIIQMKINHACDLFRSGLYTVTQVAQICGYDNIYYFSRQFKEYVGISPAGFAKKYVSSK